MLHYICSNFNMNAMCHKYWSHHTHAHSSAIYLFDMCSNTKVTFYHITSQLFIFYLSWRALLFLIFYFNQLVVLLLPLSFIVRNLNTLMSQWDHKVLLILFNEHDLLTNLPSLTSCQKFSSKEDFCTFSFRHFSKNSITAKACFMCTNVNMDAFNWAPFIPSPRLCINTIASIHALHGAYFSPSLFVNSNGGAPKGRWRGNKWGIFSLLNGALEGLWLGVVGYKTQWFGCIHVLVHWLMGWQLCCSVVVLGCTLGYALRCSFGKGALSDPLEADLRSHRDPHGDFLLHRTEWSKTTSRGGMLNICLTPVVHFSLGDCVSQFVVCFLFILMFFRILSQM